MSKSSFASLVCSKIKAAVGDDGSKFGSSSPQSAQQAIADAITEYLVANVKVNVTYTGTLNNGKPDPVVEDVFTLTGVCSAVSTPGSYEAWLDSIQQSIATSFSGLTPGTAGVVADFKPFNPTSGSLQIVQSDLKSAHESNLKDPMQSVWEVVCGGIMDWINSSASINPAASGVAASRPGTSTGTISVVGIVVN